MASKLYNYSDIIYSGKSTIYQNQSWASEIDDLRIYNRALSDSEIYSLFISKGKK